MPSARGRVGRSRKPFWQASARPTAGPGVLTVTSETVRQGRGRRSLRAHAIGDSWRILRFPGNQNPRLQLGESRGWLGKTHFAAQGLGLGRWVQLSVRVRLLTVPTSDSGAWLRPTCDRRPFRKREAGGKPFVYPSAPSPQSTLSSTHPPTCQFIHLSIHPSTRHKTSRQGLTQTYRASVTTGPNSGRKLALCIDVVAGHTCRCPPGIY